MRQMEKKLLTPGPLTTSAETKKAMLNDWGSRDKEFIHINSSIRESLLRIINGENLYECIPLQGSGTFAVESMIGSLIPKQSKILILINGAYGHRVKTICSYLNVDSIEYEVPEDQIHDLVKVEKIIDENQDLTHVFIVYCETTSGILNPIKNIADLVSNKNLSLFIDAMSAFGALPLSCKNIEFDAIAASSNKCLEGVPGISFVLVKKDLINQSQGNSHSLSLDLFDQWQSMEKNKQWRFTPPTHVLAAFKQALKEHHEEGGVEARFKRYSENCKIICNGMKKIGFKQLLPNHLQSPIIITFLQPDSSNFIFEKFYEKLSEKGFLIYPGKLTSDETFRIGCIGHLNSNDMNNAIKSIQECLKELDVNLN